MKLTRLQSTAKKVTLSTQEKEKVVAVPVVLESPYTEEEIVYNDLVKRYPLLGDFVKETGLVFVSTLEPPREIEDQNRALYKLAKELLSPERSYTPEEVVGELEKAKKITKERAERGFNMMRTKGAIVRVEHTQNRYRVNIVT
jgi:hypothetical protein